MAEALANWPSIIGTVLLGLTGFVVLVLIPVWFAAANARRERDLEHAERIRAIEMGRSLSGDQPWWTPERVGVVVGAGVPIGVFLIAWAAASGGPPTAAYAIWPSAGAVGVTALICGTVLASRLTSTPTVTDPQAKPAHDPDAFDVVARRG